jgi:hypothetical protein
MRLFSLLCLWLLLPQANRSPDWCTCNDGGPFLTVAPPTSLVALVKVNKYTSFRDIQGKNLPLSMQAEIVDIYKGKETRQQIIVWGDNGAQCRPYLSQFKENNYYVIAFDSISSKNTLSRVKEYYISDCGTYWLTVDSVNKIATGRISERSNSLKLYEIMQKLLANDQRLRSTDQDH